MGEAQLLPSELIDRMMDMARFRNLLVHVYWAIDHEKVHDSLSSRLATLEAFTSHISRWIKQQE
jgi:uncharacterized protein YutE (UPF0331/DUF86 family)